MSKAKGARLHPQHIDTHGTCERLDSPTQLISLGGLLVNPAHPKQRLPMENSSHQVKSRKDLAWRMEKRNMVGERQKKHIPFKTRLTKTDTKTHDMDNTRWAILQYELES